jgi:hypothetical protein
VGKGVVEGGGKREEGKGGGKGKNKANKRGQKKTQVKIYEGEKKYALTASARPNIKTRKKRKKRKEKDKK